MDPIGRNCLIKKTSRSIRFPMQNSISHLKTAWPTYKGVVNISRRRLVQYKHRPISVNLYCQRPCIYGQLKKTHDIHFINKMLLFNYYYQGSYFPTTSIGLDLKSGEKVFENLHPKYMPEFFRSKSGHSIQNCREIWPKSRTPKTINHSTFTLVSILLTKTLIFCPILTIHVFKKFVNTAFFIVRNLTHSINWIVGFPRMPRFDIQSVQGYPLEHM
jgi:hypothetical protein